MEGDGDKILLSVEQTMALDNLTENNGVHRILYGGQAGGGKSFLICIWLISMANNYEATRYYMARRVLKDLRDSILLTFFDVAKLMNVTFRYFDKTKIQFPNGSEIHLLECEVLPSDPNFDRLGSKEYTAGAIEEGIDVARRAADVLMSRTRYKHDVYNLERKQLITCNPGLGWIKDDIVEPSVLGTLSKKVLFIPATLESNPNAVFAQSYRENLEEMPTFERQRLLHGDWNARPKTGGEFWKDFKREVQVVSSSYDPSLPLHLTFDENVNPYLTCLVFQLDTVMRKGVPVKYARQIDELCLPDPRNTRRAICSEFERRYYHHTSGLFIYGDATSQKADTGKEKGENFFTDILAHLKSYRPQKRVPKANPSVAASGTFINAIWEAQNEGNLYRGIQLTVDPKCKTSVDDYLYTLEDSDGTIKKVTAVNPNTLIRYEINGHCSDALRYIMTMAYSGEYAQHLRGGRMDKPTVGTDKQFRTK